MCGIIGYIGFRKASEVVLRGLKTLEYRGYDSAGIAISDKGKITVKKDAGKVEEVSNSLMFTSLEGNMGIGHTRWATHGRVCRENAHPHSNCSKNIALVHNGVIENYIYLKDGLLERKHKFESETDSEVIAHLMEENMKTMPPEQAFRETVKILDGSYAIAAIVKGEEKLFAARKNSPMIFGIGKGEHFIASDIPAILPYTKKIIPVEDGRILVASAKDFKIMDFHGNSREAKPIEVDWSSEVAEKGGFPHFMLKEIYDQKIVLPESIAANTKGAEKLISNAKNIHLIACGTSHHAAILFSILFEKRMQKNAKAFIASEYPFVASTASDTLVIAISQSGETADTLQAVKFAKSKGAKILALTNVVGSSITRISDETVYLNAGPEVSVAATKTFSSQLAVIYKIVFGKDASDIPQIVGRALENEPEIKKISEKLKSKHNVFFLGRGISYPIAMEGALKLKELSYMHAEAYPGGELKHGPLSLIEEGIPVIALAPNDETAAKMLGSIKEVKARGAFVIALTDNKEIAREADAVLEMEKAEKQFYPFAMLPQLQMLAYYASVSRGIDPDRPRNLAKSVTVE